MARHSTGRTRFLGSFTDALPAPSLPEVAFAGRSNVGKSSALNALAGVGSLARVAKTPGRTQAINLFAVEDAWIAADLPGYGYARVQQTLREQWKGLIESYLGERPTLRLVVALLDVRIPPQALDGQLLSGLSAAEIPTLVVATKVDALSPTRRAAAVAELARGHGLPPEAVVPFSSHDGIGRDTVLQVIRRVCKAAAPPRRA
jgi:GTP-binding protein